MSFLLVIPIFLQMGKACMFMTILTDLYKLFLAEMQDNAFAWVRLWVSTRRWKKCPTFNKSWGILSWQVVCPFFAKLCFGWFMVQHLSQTEFPGIIYQAKQQKLEKWDDFSHQGKLMPAILLLPPQPVSVPGFQKGLNIVGIRMHCSS